MSHRYFEELLECLRARDVRYLIVGGYAVAFHAEPRFTKDLDLLLDPAVENVDRTLSAVRDFFGGADPGIVPQDFSDPANVVQLGVAPVRVDILTSLLGTGDFEALWRARAAGKFGGVPTQFISLVHLIEAKKATGRPRDRLDVKVLSAVRDRNPIRRRPGDRIRKRKARR